MSQNFHGKISRFKSIYISLVEWTGLIYKFIFIKYRSTERGVLKYLSDFTLTVLMFHLSGKSVLYEPSYNTLNFSSHGILSPNGLRGKIKEKQKKKKKETFALSVSV